MTLEGRKNHLQPAQKMWWALRKSFSLPISKSFFNGMVSLSIKTDNLQQNVHCYQNESS